MIEIRRSALVRHAPEKMFNLVNDVNAYPDRFSWCTGAQILRHEDDAAVVRLDLRFAGLRHSFTTRNRAQAPDRITVSLVEGPFRSLEGQWSFDALGDSGCKVGLLLDFDYQGFGGTALKFGFQSLANRMVDDFCRVADRVHG